MYKAIDLFAGAGGLSLGFELAGIDVVAAVEYCDKAVRTYKHNFPSHLTYCEDIKKVTTKQVEDDLLARGIKKSEIDLVIGGPPCPGFSNIGRSKIISLLRDGVWNFDNHAPDELRHQFIQDPRNQLFLEFVRFVNDFEPKGFVMENVPGMLTSKTQNGMAITKLIEDEFDNIGYTCQKKVLLASDYGVPQARNRVIFIGWKKGSPELEFSHPLATHDTPWTSLEAISDLPFMSQEGGVSNEQCNDAENEYQNLMRFGAFSNAGRVDVRTGKVPTLENQSELSCHRGRWVNPRDRAIFPELQQPIEGKRTTYDLIEPSELKFPNGWKWDENNQLVINDKSGKDKKSYKWYNRKSFKDKMRRIPWHKPSPTLVAHMATDTYMYIHPEPETNRTITPQEAARIQSFPDGFDFSEVSFTSQYRQIGNAVPPLMGKAIADSIIESWGPEVLEEEPEKEDKIMFETSTGPPRIITAASLFDGHDAAINVMRRLIQSAGAEVIHLGHDQSAKAVVDCAIQEDAHGIALTSYQGGHVEYFKYIRQLLDEAGCKHIRIFGGGGGTITPPEIKTLHKSGISKIYSPDDGRAMGLMGMINHLMGIASEVDLISKERLSTLDEPVTPNDPAKVGLLLTISESAEDATFKETLDKCRSSKKEVPVIGFTGTGGAGKSSLLDELMLRILRDNPGKKVCLLCVDPTRKRTGGALLGDRIRMNSLSNNDLYMRSLASRGSGSEISANLDRAIEVAKAVGFDLIFCETSGIGQGSDAITTVADHSMYVMTAEFGAHTQLEKIEMLDVADVVVLNKYEKRGSEDALRAIRKQVRRNRNKFDVADEELPIVATIASQFADGGVDRLWSKVAKLVGFEASLPTDEMGERKGVIPAERVHYLSEISATVRDYHAANNEIAEKLRLCQHLETAAGNASERGSKAVAKDLQEQIDELLKEVAEAKSALSQFRQLAEEYSSGEYTYHVRGKPFTVKTTTESLAHSDISRVALPNFADDGELYSWIMRENAPGHFPYTAGVFPFKRTDELSARMFAGEGGPERTNRRFHYLSQGQDYVRLSTAFDSVTLYGRDPEKRPDIWGKVGNSGVSIATCDDAKRLYSGFDLCNPNTSVSMTINGPAPIILAFYLNAAIDQQVEAHLKSLKKPMKIGKSAYSGKLPKGHNGFGLATVGKRGDKLVDAKTYADIKAKTLQTVRGTVQADILKEDQAQNTCIFSTQFALKLMGDVQQYYIDHGVRNHYSVSISGYHIAEAGANPITQLAFTLANGFTYVEYYRSRGMDINKFAPNLSFFFSNGLDPEYTVIGRVARRIWAVAMRDMYGGDERSQKLKYHIQTSGRSLHAQEIDFNDIRTTLQALLAIQDNANSLHTNAYDEAITTPTEESVRRALAIQLIVNQESGWTKTENPMQGSFIVDELTELVEAAVLDEFEAISRRGGVLGAMETMYQRGKIQDESMYYEHLKHDGTLPIIGVNTFQNPNAQAFDESAADDFVMELARATPQEKQECLKRVKVRQTSELNQTTKALKKLQEVARTGGNVFEELMETVKVASLGQITDSLFKVGGQYRRNM